MKAAFRASLEKKKDIKEKRDSFLSDIAGAIWSWFQSTSICEQSWGERERYSMKLAFIWRMETVIYWLCFWHIQGSGERLLYGVSTRHAKFTTMGDRGCNGNFLKSRSISLRPTLCSLSLSRSSCMSGVLQNVIVYDLRSAAVQVFSLLLRSSRRLIKFVFHSGISFRSGVSPKIASIIFVIFADLTNLSSVWDAVEISSETLMTKTFLRFLTLFRSRYVWDAEANVSIFKKQIRMTHTKS